MSPIQKTFRGFLLEKNFYWGRIILGGFFCLFLLVILVIMGYLVYLNEREISPVAFTAGSSPVSSSSRKNHSTTDNYPPTRYFPLNLTPRFSQAEEEIRQANQDDPRGITAKAWAAMDRDGRELLVAKNLTEKLPIASITKVMTAIVALENAPLDKVLIVSDEATKAGEATMGLTAGEKLTVEELLYGMMLPSGNDAAETLAMGVFPAADQVASRITFLGAMNNKAESIGMFDTFFANPTGLDEDTLEQSSHSTALDLLALGNYALENQTFARIAATKQVTLEYKKGFHRRFYLTNILDLNKSFPGIKGIKPGITDFAGETLLSYAENGNKRIILVLLGSTATKDDAVKLYEYLFDKLGVKVER